MDEEFIEKYSKYIELKKVGKFNLLSEEFINKHIKILNIRGICLKNNLSDEFIEKHKDKLDWYMFSKVGNLKENMLSKYKDKIYWDRIMDNKNISISTLSKYKDKLNIDIYLNYKHKREQNHKNKYYNTINYKKIYKVYKILGKENSNKLFGIKYNNIDLKKIVTLTNSLNINLFSKYIIEKDSDYLNKKIKRKAKMKILKIRNEYFKKKYEIKRIKRMKKKEINKNNKDRFEVVF